MRLELRGITKRFGDLVANDHIDLDRASRARSTPCSARTAPASRTLMNVLYGLLPAGRGRDPGRRRAGRPSRARRRHRGRHRHGAPALHARPGLHRGRERHARRRADAGVGFLDRARRPARGARGLRAVRPPGRPGRAGRGPAGRRPAARRDRQGADPRRRPADPRRADRRAHPAGDRRPARTSCGAEGRRQVDRLHHPQAARGQGDRRPDHRDPARQGRRHGRADRHARRAGRDDGRPQRHARSVEKAARAGRAGPRGRRAAWSPTTGTSARSTASTSRCGPARCSASPACRATARPSWSRRSWGCARVVRHDHLRRQGHHADRHRREVLRAGRRLHPEDRSVDGLVKELLRRREPGARHLPPTEPFGGRFALDPADRRIGQSRVEEFDIRTSSDRAPGRYALRRQPAEGHRRPGDVAAAEAAHRSPSPPAASTSGSIEFIHAASSPSATSAPPCWWSPASWTRSLGAGRPDRGDVPRPDPRRSARPGTPREEIGLLMAGMYRGAATR